MTKPHLNLAVIITVNLEIPSILDLLHTYVLCTDFIICEINF